MDIRNLYHELEIIKENENKRLVLVRNKIDHLLYLKREIPAYNKEVYYQLAKIKLNKFLKFTSFKKLVIK
ncbi:hypothetical protein SD457_04580 [Coprobacillaceae bacterium CR2/5/TPMF4]|nr:hypothetical protein SD457_04580 [Coprobacillaceae bacterium CR2/5/TPMF4]